MLIILFFFERDEWLWFYRMLGMECMGVPSINHALVEAESTLASGFVVIERTCQTSKQIACHTFLSPMECDSEV